MRSRLRTAASLLSSHLRVPFVSTNITFGPFVLIRLVSAPIRGKVSALVLGASGLGTVGVLQNFQMLMFSLGSLGLGNGLTAEISSRTKSGDLDGANRAIAVTFSALSIASIFAVSVILLGISAISENILGDRSLSKLLLAPTLALPFYCFGTCYLEAILYGKGMPTQAAAAYKISALVDLFAFVPLVILYGVQGASIGILVAVVSHFTVLLFQVRRYCPELKLFRFGRERQLFSKFLKTGLTILFSGAAAYGGTLAVRAIIIHSLGDVVNGYYQVVISLSSIYIPFITSGTWVRLYPQVGGQGLDDSVGEEVIGALVYSALFASISQCLLLVAPDLIIKTLYSSEFLAATQIVPLRLIGDYGFIVSQPILGVLLGLRARRAYLALLICSQVLFVVLAQAASGQGILGPAAAYAISNIVLMAISLFWFYTKVGSLPSISKNRLRLMGLIFMLLMAVIVQGALLATNLSFAWRILWLAAVSGAGFFILQAIQNKAALKTKSATS